MATRRLPHHARTTRSARGVTVVEYGLIVALIALAAIITAIALGLVELPSSAASSEPEVTWEVGPR